MAAVYTHTLTHFRDKDTSTLSRDSDGMIIAVRKDKTVGFGEDPRNQEQRVFIDKSKAAAFIVKIADIDWQQQMIAAGRPPAETYHTSSIRDVEGDKRVTLAGAVQ